MRMNEGKGHGSRVQVASPILLDDGLTGRGYAWWLDRDFMQVVTSLLEPALHSSNQLSTTLICVGAKPLFARLAHQEALASRETSYWEMSGFGTYSSLKEHSRLAGVKLGCVAFPQHHPVPTAIE